MSGILRLFCLGIFCIFSFALCDGLDNLTRYLTGVDDNKSDHNSETTTLNFVNLVKMADNDRGFWDTGSFTQANDATGDADSNSNYGDISDVAIAHNGNNLYVEVTRDDGAWDFANDTLRLDISTNGEEYTVRVDFSNTYTVVRGSDTICDNASQEIVEAVHDGQVVLIKVPLNQSENVINCFDDEVRVIDKMRAVIENESGQRKTQHCSSFTNCPFTGRTAYSALTLAI